MAQTAMARAFTEKGITPREAAFSLAIARFQNNGGTYERAKAMLDAAYEKGSGGPTWCASDGQRTDADASRLNDGEAGHSITAERASSDAPVSPSTERSEGQQVGTEKAVQRAPSAAPPVHVAEHRRNMPGHAKRGPEAIASVQSTMAKSAFMAIRLDDGRALGEVRWSEAPMLAQRISRHARILIAAHRYAVPADPTTPLHDVVPADEQANISRMMERLNEF